MKYAFKIITVVLALGVLVLQGCQTTKNKYVGEYKDGQYHGYGSMLFPSGEIYEGEWKFGKRDGQGTNIWKNGAKYVGGFSNGLRHGIGKQIFSNGNIYDGEYRNNQYHGYGKYFFITGETYSGEWKFGKRNGKGTNIWPNGDKYSGEFLNDKRHGTGILTFNDGRKTSGIWRNDVIFKKLEVKPFINKAWIGVGLEQLTKERSYDLGLRNTFGALIVSVKSGSPASIAGLKSQDVILNFNTKKIMKMQDLQKFVSLTPIGQNVTLTVWRDRKILKKNIILGDSGFIINDNVVAKTQINERKKFIIDKQGPVISTYVNVDGSTAIVSGTITDNTEIKEVFVDKLQLPILAGGVFEFKEYIPRAGKTIEIVAYDIKGNKASKLLKIERDDIQQASGPKFDALNPSGNRVKSNPNALALIIGVANYEKTPANALYADKDAQQFYDYATMKLGIPSSNIKELVNDKADLGEIGLAVQDWIARSTKQGKTDIYVFFAGHGLASDDGKNMYLLPYDGRPRLLDKTALLRDELFKEIQQSNPRSVTVFLDTCYSGTTRSTDMLIASRPIFIPTKEQSIPDNFTVFSAAAGDQTSKPLEEAKHGMFSYFLMKGMEGDADANNDNKITARELHAYVEQNVVQQSSGSQTPELQGDADRVLVQFN